MSEHAGDWRASVRRLFPHHALATSEHDASAALIIGRLLEEGDGHDLHWLSRRYGEDRLRSWVRRRGLRQLSGRSLAFWQVILDLEPAGSPENPLWPT